MQMTILKGDAGGMLFRTDDTGNNFYYFRIGRDGSYILYLSNGNNVTTLRQKATSAIKTGLNQMNLIAVVAQGNKFDFYVNKQHVDTVTDKTYIEGRIGVAADDDNNPTEVMFNNAMVWIL